MKKLMMMAIIGILAMSLFVGCEESTPEKIENPPPQAQPEEPPQASQEIFEIGDTVGIGNWELTINSTRHDDGDEFSKPEDGEVWLTLDITMQNLSDEQRTVSSYMMFELVDIDGRKQDEAMWADTNGRVGGDLGAGRRLAGEIAFKVSEEKQKFELVFNPSVFGSGQAIFNIPLEPTPTD